MTSYNLLSGMRVGCQRSFIKQPFLKKTALLSNQPARGFSNNLALISKIHREFYLRSYPTLVVQSDGSSFYTRYHEPRSIIQLPLDLSTMTEEEMKARLLKRNPKKKVVYAKEEEDTFKASRYINLVKKSKK